MKSPNARVIETETLIEHGRGFLYFCRQGNRVAVYVYRRSVQLMGYWIFPVSPELCIKERD